MCYHRVFKVNRSLKQPSEPALPLHRNQLHLQKVQLQQALSDTRGGVRFAERLLARGSDAEILNAKGVTLARLTSLVESGYDPSPATVAPDDSSSIHFLPGEGAGEVDGYPVVGVIQTQTLDLSRCTIEGEGKATGALLP